MAVIRTQVTLDRDTGLPADQVVNTFHVSGAIDDTGLAAVQTAIDVFYTTAGQFLSATFAGTGTTKFYDEADPEPRVPVYSSSGWAWTPGSGTEIEEAAICLSYQAAPVSGISQARRRGRMFLGPLSQNTRETLTGGRVRIAVGVRTALLDALEVFYDSCNVAGYTFGVWSPTSLQFVGVTTAWVDDAYDTIRSRGPAPLTRSLKTLVP